MSIHHKFSFTLRFYNLRHTLHHFFVPAWLYGWIQTRHYLSSFALSDAVMCTKRGYTGANELFLLIMNYWQRVSPGLCSWSYDFWHGNHQVGSVSQSG